MEICTNTTTASTPATGMPISGHLCAAVRAFGADLAATTAGVIGRRKGDFGAFDAWRPLTS